MALLLRADFEDVLMLEKHEIRNRTTKCTLQFLKVLLKLYAFET